MKKFSFLESEGEEKEMEMKQADDEKKDGVKVDHADAEQDKALFAKLIKDYLGKEDADEMEMEMAKQAYQAHKEAGMETEAAMEAAGKHLKMAAEIGKKMHQAMQSKEEKKEGEGEKETEAEGEAEKKETEGEGEKEAEDEAKESECKDEEDEKKEAQSLPASVKKEAARVVKLSGEVAKLREALKTYELKDYLEAKLRKSGESNACTKLFREALGKPRSEKHIDETWNTFIKAYKAGAEEVGSDDVFFLEKQSHRGSEGKKVSFADCLDS
jgi:hypothetical protein